MGDAAEPAGSAAPDDRGRRGASGISAFIARVLEQLSPNSWLPAVFLVGNVAVLLAIEPSGWNLGLWDAISRLTDMEWGALVVLLFAVVISTIAIQAFEFELLRTLEGYWRGPALLVRCGERLIKHHTKKRAGIVEKIADVEAAWIHTKLEASILAGNEEDAALWRMALKSARHSGLSPEEIARIRQLGDLRQRSPLDAETDHQLVVLKLRLADYPEPERILPTRLGNVMRSAEDQVELQRGSNLEGFMIRHLDHLPATIADEYRVYRERLDMYCGMVFVLLALFLTATVALPFDPSGAAWHVVIPAMYLVAIVPCYNAAIASARGFGGALIEADGAVRRLLEPAAPSAAHSPSISA